MHDVASLPDAAHRRMADDVRRGTDAAPQNAWAGLVRQSALAYSTQSVIYLFDDFDCIDGTVFARLLSTFDAEKQRSILRYQSESGRQLALAGAALIRLIAGRGAVIEFGEYGKPHCRGPNGFNISHCRMCAVAIAGRGDVGIDVEAPREFSARLMQKCFTPFEQRQVSGAANPKEMFLTLWTLKESYVKAIGKGLFYSLRSVEFDVRSSSVQCSDREFVCTSFLHAGKYRVAGCVQRQNAMALDSIKIVSLADLEYGG
jgi:phosphopantetheine--protein transferase-like protein